MKLRLSYLGSGAVTGVILFCLSSLPAGATPRSLGDLTGPWQLLVDDALIAEKHEVVRVYHPFEKNPRNPVLVADRPWEGQIVYLYGTVLPNETGPGYRMWYHSYDGEYRNLYATSLDGVAWQKSDLGLVTFNGSKANNLFLRRTVEDHLPQVIHTPWETDPAVRYKLVNYDYGRTPPNHLTSGFYGATSIDGIVWNDAASNPILPDPGDVGNFVWDAHRQRYLGYPKVFANVRGFNRRCVGFSSTVDFEHWPAAQLILTPDEQDDSWTAGGGQRTEFYGLSGFPYEAGYLGFLWVFHITDGNNDGPIHCELVSSRDGMSWTRQAAQAGGRVPMLALGAPGRWDDGMVFTPNHPLVEGDTIKLWYGGFGTTHNQPGVTESASIGLATLRKDGFASLDAGGAIGTVTTKRLEALGGELHVNVCATNGWLRVEVLDRNGAVLPGYSRTDCDPVRTNSVDALVTWAAHRALPVVEGPLRLRFVLQNASLYSFKAGETADLDVEAGLNLLYDFEGDTGQAARDKLGAHDGTLRNAVHCDATPGYALFGSQSARFDAPQLSAEPNSTVEIPETTQLGPAFTLAACIRSSNTSYTRLFTSYDGAGPLLAGELVFAFDPSGVIVPGLYLNIRGEVTQTPAVPLGLATPGYHHVAMTFDHGAVAMYLDGTPVTLTRPTLPITEVTGLRNLRFGEDSGGAAGNEQFLGSADELLVLGRALGAHEVAAIAASGVRANVVPGAGERAILYDFEGDSTVTFTDKLSSDGAQNGLVHNNARVDEAPDNARFGVRSAVLSAPLLSSPFNAIDVGPVGNLGSEFTMAAAVRVPGGGQTAGGLTRLFSTYSGSGSAAGRLIFDFDPGASVSGIGLRLLLPDGTEVISDATFSVNTRHHLAAVCDSGSITLYLDGSPVASGNTTGAVNLGAFPLRIGEDLDGPVNEQFVGALDDVLVLNRALSGTEVQQLATTGAGRALTVRVTSARLTGPDLVLDWEGGFDGLFGIQQTRSLAAPAWTTITNTSSRSATLARSGGAAFLRVVQ
ncbi:MAG TPA: hypothetical protein PK640_07900 [Verrucomicrobiota bacterium]|nr:hypothetical protein [Verrucomicrobiota bacterium]